MYMHMHLYMYMYMYMYAQSLGGLGFARAGEHESRKVGAALLLPRNSLQDGILHLRPRPILCSLSTLNVRRVDMFHQPCPRLAQLLSAQALS